MSKANLSRTSVIISFCLILLVVSGLMLNNSYTIKASGSSIQIDKEKSPPLLISNLKNCQITCLCRS